MILRTVQCGFISSTKLHASLADILYSAFRRRYFIGAFLISAGEFVAVPSNLKNRALI